ncbi:NADAR family protein [Corallincola luteus]|uniref:DUF1768 domain-containing protein n=2 Tax=Corallincola TaxID=1775176 RepID=A0A368NLX5_9GAMM|nr:MULTISPECIES: NADAR family protein [Corallincola]RCU50835.1 DUF1768 domain-containing protein [Corallincola holothuriorum]TCI03891.1 NADAR family protein [Corallincola luteus]
MPELRDIQQLVDYVNYGNCVKYVFFWGHKKPEKGVSKSCFSQWYEAPFIDDGVKFLTAEHYMMAAKAKLFGDQCAYERIITASNPGAAKKFGREVLNFDEQVWCQHRFEIVVQANLLKFDQHAELKAFLLGTGERILVEASPVDRVWGIGLSADDPHAENPNQWKGANLLGFALMEVRQRFTDLVV